MEYINELNDSLENNKGYDTVGKILKKLSEYAKYHFSTEEDYFEEFNYENEVEHIRLHEKYIDKLIELVKKYNSGDVFVPRETLLFLKNWLINHICNEDRKYIECFRNNGL